LSPFSDYLCLLCGLDPEPDGTMVGKLKIVRNIACTWEGFDTWTPPTT
jgi:hypothetical protein